LNKANALIVKLAKHHQKRQENLTATFVAKVLINQNRARPLVWIASLESTNRTLKNLTALNVKKEVMRLTLPERLTAIIVLLLVVNQKQVQLHALSVYRVRMQLLVVPCTATIATTMNTNPTRMLPNAFQFKKVITDRVLQPKLNAQLVKQEAVATQHVLNV